jgi:hypothetical protein
VPFLQRYAEPNAINNALDYAKFYSQSNGAVICVFDDAGNVTETHEHAGDLKGWSSSHDRQRTRIEQLFRLAVGPARR